MGDVVAEAVNGTEMDRQSILDGMDKIPAPVVSPAGSAAPPPVAAADPAVALADDADLDALADDDATEVEAAPDDPDADLLDEPAAPVDADTAKRLKLVDQQKKHARAELARERQDWEREKAAWAEQQRPAHEAAKKFDTLKERVRVDPIGVLAELGLSEDFYEPIARKMFALSPAGKADPKQREYADKLLQERAATDKVSAVEKKLADALEKLEAKDKAADTQRQLEAYYGGAEKLVTDKTPVVQRLLKGDPNRARHEMSILAYSMAQETGTAPAQKALIIAYEKQERARLRALGIDPLAQFKAAAPAANENKTAVTPAKKPVAAAPAKPGATLAPLEVTPPAEKNAFTRDERERDPFREQLLKELDERKLS